MKALWIVPLLLLAGCGGGGGPERDDGKVRVLNADPTSDPAEVLVDGVLRDTLEYGETLNLTNGGADFELTMRGGGDTYTKNVKLTEEEIDAIVLTRDGYRTAHDRRYEGSGSVKVRILIDETDTNLDVVLTGGSEYAEDAIERWTDVSKSGEPVSRRFSSGTHRVLAVTPGTDNVVAESDTFSKSDGDIFVMVREGSARYLKRFQK